MRAASYLSNRHVNCSRKLALLGGASRSQAASVFSGYKLPIITCGGGQEARRWRRPRSTVAQEARWRKITVVAAAKAAAFQEVAAAAKNGPKKQGKKRERGSEVCIQAQRAIHVRTVDVLYPGMHIHCFCFWTTAWTALRALTMTPLWPQHRTSWLCCTGFSAMAVTLRSVNVRVKSSGWLLLWFWVLECWGWWRGEGILESKTGNCRVAISPGK